MKRPAKGLSAKHPYTDVKRDLTAEQLASVGAVTLAWNGLEGCIDVLVAIASGLDTSVALHVISRINGFDGKIAIATKGLQLYFRDSEKFISEINTCFTAAGQCKIDRDAVIHAHVLDPKGAIGGGMERRGKLYEVTLSQTALDGLYDRIVLVTKELIGLVWATMWFIIRKKMDERSYSWKENERERIEPIIQAYVTQFRGDQKRRKSLPQPPSPPEEPQVPLGLGDMFLASLNYLSDPTSSSPLDNMEAPVAPSPSPDKRPPP